MCRNYTYLLIPSERVQRLWKSRPIVERKRRNAILQKISDEKLEKFYNENKGRKEYVLWEDSKNKKIMSGFSGNYIKVEAPYNADMINTFTEVIL